MINHSIQNRFHSTNQTLTKCKQTQEGRGKDSWYRGRDPGATKGGRAAKNWEDWRSRDGAHHRSGGAVLRVKDVSAPVRVIFFFFEPCSSASWKILLQVRGPQTPTRCLNSNLVFLSIQNIF
jgi:hypothetical protein